MMPIEKAFAIEAEPAAIWEALWSDLGAGDADRFSVERSSWPSLLEVRVELGGLPTLLVYRIEPKEAYTEVSVTLEPLSFRYRLFQFFTFGHLRRNYEMLLVQGLVNLKKAVEEGTVSMAEDDDAPADD